MAKLNKENPHRDLTKLETRTGYIKLTQEKGKIKQPEKDLFEFKCYPTKNSKIGFTFHCFQNFLDYEVNSKKFLSINKQGVSSGKVTFSVTTFRLPGTIKDVNSHGPKRAKENVYKSYQLAIPEDGNTIYLSPNGWIPLTRVLRRSISSKDIKILRSKIFENSWKIKDSELSQIITSGMELVYYKIYQRFYMPFINNNGQAIYLEYLDDSLHYRWDKYLSGSKSEKIVVSIEDDIIFDSHLDIFKTKAASITLDNDILDMYPTL